MSLSRRITRIIRANRSAREPVPDPLQTVDEAHRRQVELLDQARRSIADLAASRRRLEILAADAAAEADHLDRLAASAVASGNDDDARAALRRGLTVRKRMDALNGQREALDGQVRQLDATLQRLESRVEEDGLRYHTLKARHGAAQAALEIGGALDTSGRAAAGAQSAAREAETRARQLEARAAANEELSWSDPNSRRVEEAFEQLEAYSTTEAELAQLKARKNPTNFRRGQ